MPLTQDSASSKQLRMNVAPDTLNRTRRPVPPSGERSCPAPGCGKPLVRRIGERSNAWRDRRTCGHLCAGAITRSRRPAIEQKTCDAPGCGATFTRGLRESGWKWLRRRFCGRACAGAAHREHWKSRQRAIDTEGDKPCTRCGEVLPLECFGWRLGKRTSICRTCSTAIGTMAYWMNPGKRRESARVYAQNHKEKVKQRVAAWRVANREMMLLRQRQYNERRRGKMNQYMRERREAMSPAERKAMYRRHSHSPRAIAWRVANIEKIRRLHTEKENRRRALRAGVEISSVARDRVIERDHATCYLCGRALPVREITLDHVIPLVRGGPHSENNLRVACRSCNSSKGHRTPEEYQAGRLVPRNSSRRIETTG